MPTPTPVSGTLHSIGLSGNTPLGSECPLSGRQSGEIACVPLLDDQFRSPVLSPLLRGKLRSPILLPPGLRASPPFASPHGRKASSPLQSIRCSASGTKSIVTTAEYLALHYGLFRSRKWHRSSVGRWGEVSIIVLSSGWDESPVAHGGITGG